MIRVQVKNKYNQIKLNNNTNNDSQNKVTNTSNQYC